MTIIIIINLPEEWLNKTNKLDTKSTPQIKTYLTKKKNTLEILWMGQRLFLIQVLRSISLLDKTVSVYFVRMCSPMPSSVAYAQLHFAQGASVHI